jgi:hypothetical protein
VNELRGGSASTTAPPAKKDRAHPALDTAHAGVGSELILIQLLSRRLTSTSDRLV